MIINYKKCGIMELHGNKDSVEEIEWQGKFPQVQKYKYLGVEIN